MNKINVKRENVSSMGPLSRLVKMLIGVIMIASVVLQNGFLGWVTLLPLLAIYPISVSITGFSPVKEVYGLLEQWLHNRLPNRNDMEFYSNRLSVSS